MRVMPILCKTRNVGILLPYQQDMDTVSASRKGLTMIVKGKRTPADTIIRLIEAIFYRECEIRKAVKDARLDAAMHYGELGHRSGKGFLSDPTAVQAIKNMQEVQQVVLHDGFIVRYPERWIRVIDGTYSIFDDMGKQVLKSRYSRKTHFNTCYELHIGSSTFYRIIETARNFATAAACQLGLVQVM